MCHLWQVLYKQEMLTKLTWFPHVKKIHNMILQNVVFIYLLCILVKKHMLIYIYIYIYIPFYFTLSNCTIIIFIYFKP